VNRHSSVIYGQGAIVVNFKEILFDQLDDNPFTKVEEWALLTAGTKDKFNMMTITGIMCG
jgi:hypothetical protein